MTSATLLEMVTINNNKRHKLVTGRDKQVPSLWTKCIIKHYKCCSPNILNYKCESENCHNSLLFCLVIKQADRCLQTEACMQVKHSHIKYIHLKQRDCWCRCPVHRRVNRLVYKATANVFNSAVSVIGYNHSPRSHKLLHDWVTGMP